MSLPSPLFVFVALGSVLFSRFKALQKTTETKESDELEELNLEKVTVLTQFAVFYDV